MNWLQYLQLAFTILGAIETAATEIQAGQPFSTPPLIVTLYGKKYSITISGTPQ